MKTYSIRILSIQEFEAEDDDAALALASVEWLDENVVDFVIKEVCHDGYPG